jgi:pimeloyl-ACP methyl ester carboxylesterase
MYRREAFTGQRWFVRLKRAILWLVLGVLGLAALGSLYQIIGTALDRRASSPPGQMIDVGGYQMYLYCTGANQEGSATVILDTGLGATSSTWARLQPEIAKATQVCSYDRAGMGWSDPGSKPRDAKQIAGELHTLLQNAGIPGPYVLVGWSYGGLYVQEFAGQYGEEVTGLVLMDSSSPDQWTSTPEAQAQFESVSTIYHLAPTLVRLGVMRVMGLLQPDPELPEPFNQQFKASFAATKDWDAQSAEFLASLASAAQVKEARFRDDIPLAVLTATVHGMSAEQEQLWQGWQTQMVSHSTNSIQYIVDGADHASFWHDPETVKVSIAAILDVVNAAQNRGALQ